MKKKIPLSQSVVLGAVFLMLALLIAGACIPTDGIGLGFTEARAFSSGWTDDSDGSSAGEAPRTVSAGETLSVSRTLGSDIGTDTWLYVYNSRFHLTVLVDGHAVYESGSRSPLAFGLETGSVWDAVPLSPDYAGKRLTLRAECLGSDSTFDFSSLCIGARNDLNLALLKRDSSVIFFSGVLILFGLLLIIYSFLFRRYPLRFGRRSFLYLGLFSIDAAAWFLSSCSVMQFLTGNASVRYLLLYFSFFALPFPALAYYRELTRRYKAMLSACSLAYGIFITALLLLYGSGLYHISFSLAWVHAAIALMIAAVTFVCLSEFFRYRDRSMAGPLAAFAVLGAAAFWDMAAYYHTRLLDISLYFRYGLLLYFVILGMTGVRQNIREYRSIYLLEHYNSMPCGILYFPVEKGHAVLPEREIPGVFSFNEECLHLLRYPNRASLQKAALSGLLSPEEDEKVRDCIRAAAQGERRQVRVQMRRFDGTAAFCSVVFEQCRFISGVAVVQCVFLDETETVEAEKKLRVSEETCRMMIDNSRSIIFRYTIADKTSYLPDRLSSLLGLPKVLANVPESVVASGSVAPGSADEYLGFFRELRAGIPCSRDRVFERKTADGSSVWFQAYYTVAADSDGSPASALVYLDDVTEKRLRENSLLQRAERDGLTGVYNRAAAEEHIRAALSLQDGRTCAFLIFDIDDLKTINDSFGHSCGDDAICATARVISEQFRKTDIVGRVGGDEFVAFLPGISNPDSLRSLLDSLLKRLDAKRVGGDGGFPLHCSIGGAFGRSLHPGSMELYRAADAALYEAKRNGKRGYVFRTPSGETVRSSLPGADAAASPVSAADSVPDLKALIASLSSYFAMIVSANLSRNICRLVQAPEPGRLPAFPAAGTAEDFLRAAGPLLAPDDREEFCSAFSRNSLLIAFSGGTNHILFRCRGDGRNSGADILLMFYRNGEGNICAFLFVHEL